ncbi:MAG: hypothetical protein RSF00_01080 [Oscillospiraceae bacterium]
MTWEQVQKITLQKLFATSAGEMLQDDATKDYINAMPAAANEAIMLLAMRGAWQERTARLMLTGEELVAGVNLNTRLEDFIEISRGAYICHGNSLVPLSGWRCCNGVLYIADAVDGQYAVSYKAMPTRISKNTPPTAQIELSQAASVLLPLYIASQLYKDDDISLSNAYRNEFEAGAEQLAYISTQEESCFTSTSGWSV